MHLQLQRVETVEPAESSVTSILFVTTYSITQGHQTRVSGVTQQLVLGTTVLGIVAQFAIHIVKTTYQGDSLRVWNKKSLTQINQCVGTHL